MCRMRQFLAVLRSFFHSSLLHTFSCHPSPPTLLPPSFTSSCHLFLGLPLNLVVPKFIYNTLLGILFSSILCTCPNQSNLFNLKCIAETFFHMVIKKQGSVERNGNKTISKNQSTNKISGSKRQTVNGVQKNICTMNTFTIFMTVIIIIVK